MEAAHPAVRRAARWGGVAAAVLVAGGLATAALLPRLVETARVRSLVVTTVSQALGRPVAFTAIDLEVLPWPAVVVRDVVVAEDPDFGVRPFARLAEARVRLRLWPLLLLRMELGDIVLRRPEVAVVQAASGRWNFASLGVPPAERRRTVRGRGGGGPAAGAVLASRVLLEDGVVTIERPRAAGELELTDMTVTRSTPQCPAPRRRTLSLGRGQVRASFADLRVTASPVTASLAGGRITAAAAAALDTGRLEVSSVALEGAAIERVLVDFLCQRYAVTGPLYLRGRATALARDPWRTLEGAGEVRVGPGRIVGSQAVRLVDVVARMAGGLAGTGSTVDYESITGTYRIDNGVLVTRDLVLKSGSLEVSATGRYALASGALDFDAVVRHRRGQLQARVTGSADAPSIRLVGAGTSAAADVRRGFERLLERFR